MICGSMNASERTGLAFFLAPMVVPIYAISWGPSGSALVFALIYGAVVGYGGMLIFGVPTWIIARSRGWTSLWIALVFGVVFGFIAWFAAGVLLSLSLEEDITLAIRLTFQPPYRYGAFWPGASLGALVALVFWLVARPDRQAR